MATTTKLEGTTKDGVQGYLVRWSEKQLDGSWKDAEQRVYGYEAARERAREMEQRHQGRKARPKSQLTVGEVAERFLRRYGTKPRQRAVGGKVGESTWEAAAREITYLADQLGEDSPFASVTADEIEAIVDARPVFAYSHTDDDGERVYLPTAEPACDGTKERMAGVLKALAADALDQGWTHVDIAAKLPSRWGAGSVKRAMIPSVRVLEELGKDLDVPTQLTATKGNGTRTAPRWLNVHDPELWLPSDRMWLFALTGLDFAEAAGLWVDDDHGDHLKLREIRDRRGNVRTHGKADSRVPREVPVPARLRPVLDRLHDYTHCGRLLTGPDGGPLAYGSWQSQLSRSAGTVGHPEYTTKALRHFAASLWIKVGATPFLVMKAGGWSSLGDGVEGVRPPVPQRRGGAVAPGRPARLGRPGLTGATMKQRTATTTHRGFTSARAGTSGTPFRDWARRPNRQTPAGARFER